MKTLILTLMLLTWAAMAHASSDVTLIWDPVTDQDLAAYRLYKSDQPGTYPSQPVITIPAGTEIVMIEVDDGTWYFVLTAIDHSGNESDPSNEVTTGELDTFPPGVPGMLRTKSIRKTPSL